MSSGASKKGARDATPRGGADPGSAILRMLNIGYGNLILASRVVAVIAPGSSPMRRLREEAAERNKLVDATQGRRTRSVIVLDSDHIVLSAINPETIAARLEPEAVGDAKS